MHCPLNPCMVVCLAFRLRVSPYAGWANQLALGDRWPDWSDPVGGIIDKESTCKCRHMKRGRKELMSMYRLASNRPHLHITYASPKMAQCCTSCQKTPPEVTLKHCAKCSVTLYCSRDCQKADWKAHKKVCGRDGCTAAGSPNSGRTDGQHDILAFEGPRPALPNATAHACRGSLPPWPRRAGWDSHEKGDGGHGTRDYGVGVPSDLHDDDRQRHGKHCHYAFGQEESVAGRAAWYRATSLGKKRIRRERCPASAIRTAYTCSCRGVRHSTALCCCRGRKSGTSWATQYQKTWRQRRRGWHN